MSERLPVAPTYPDSGRWKPVERGFPEDFQVLTHIGWVRFENLYNMELLTGSIPFVGNGYGAPGFPMKENLFGQWETGEKFPLVATVNPTTGEVFFVKPTQFNFFEYTGKLLLIKLKGVEILSTLFTDFWVLPRYARGWKFTLGDDMLRAGIATSVKYGLLNKFNVDMYGIWSPEDLLTSWVDMGNKNPLLGSTITCDIEHPIRVYPRKQLSRERIWNHYQEVNTGVDGKQYAVDHMKTSVNVFNMVVPPYHNFIIRRDRKNTNPRTKWIGGPVVVGDGLDKSELKVARVLGLNSGSYSILRPDYRSSAQVKKNINNT